MKIIERMLEEERSLGFIKQETVIEFFSRSEKLNSKDIVFGAQIIDRQRANKNKNSRTIVQI
jgi:hypothetical protein